MSILDYLKNFGRQSPNTKDSQSISNLYNPVSPKNTYHLPDRGVTVTDDDFEAFKPVLYGEVSNRNFNKKKLEADVIFNTALNRQRENKSYLGKHKTVSEIVANPEYQAYGGKQYNNYFNPPDSLSLAKKKEVDAIVDDIKDRIKSGNYQDNTEGAYYYLHNPDQSITYDNVKPLFNKTKKKK